MTPGMIAEFFRRLLGAGDPEKPTAKREEYLRRGPTERRRRGIKGNRGAYSNRIARRRRRNEIAKESRRRNRS